MDNVPDNATNTKETPKHPFPVVPTTKILAIGQFTKVPTPEQLVELFPTESGHARGCLASILSIRDVCMFGKRTVV